MNGLRPDAMLLIGQPLKLPTGSPVLASAPARTGPVSAALGAAPRRTRARAPERGRDRLDRGEHGVPGSLAAAIAWQESGFNNAMVSAANARGVMQIMPGTWAWVQRYLAPRPLDPNSASDNVHAGRCTSASCCATPAAIRHSPRPATTRALSSVRRVGMFPETRNT